MYAKLPSKDLYEFIIKSYPSLSWSYSRLDPKSYFNRIHPPNIPVIVYDEKAKLFFCREMEHCSHLKRIRFINMSRIMLEQEIAAVYSTMG